MNMNSIKQWWWENSTEITWFIMGWMTLAGIHALGQGQYITAAFDFFLVWLNYKLR
jgi:hypothetical protein